MGREPLQSFDKSDTLTWVLRVPLAAVLRSLWKQVRREEALALIQERGMVSGPGGGCAGGKKWSDPGSVLKGKPMRLADGGSPIPGERKGATKS